MLIGIHSEILKRHSNKKTTWTAARKQKYIVHENETETDDVA